jgi:hypothetical protein
MTRAVDRYLAGLLVLLLLAALAGAVPGLWMVGDDLRYSGEMFDGLGIALGLAALGVVAVPATVAVLALRRLWSGRPAAHRWALAAGVLGVLAVVPFGVFYHPLFALLVVPGLLAVAAIVTEAGRS